MNPVPEDPRPTAQALGEPGPADAPAAADPQPKSEEMASILQFLSDRLNQPPKQLLPRQRENIRRSARQAARTGSSPARTIADGGWRRWLVPAAVAAALAAAALVFVSLPGEPPAPLAGATPAPPAAAPAAGVALAEPPPEPAPEPLAEAPPEPPAPPPSRWIQHGTVTPTDFPTLELPLLVEKSNLASISKSIRDARKLPPHEAVRLEEILNGFQLRLHGVASIARSGTNTWHPDGRDSGMSRYAATLTTETITCPWKPSATLLLISIRGNTDTDCAVKIAFLANPENVFRYRLLGAASDAGTATGSLPSKLAANSGTTLAIEIEPTQPGSPLGSLEWSTDDKPAPPIFLVHKRDAEPSDDARFAALVCTYGQWLAGEQPGIIEPEIVAALAREVAAANLPADRADFLGLIAESLRLAAGAD